MQYCKDKYGHYCTFALLRLFSAVLQTNQMGLDWFESRFQSSGTNHMNNQQMKDFMESLDYVDSDYFELEELRFYLKLETSISIRSDEEVEMEKNQIKDDIKSNIIDLADGQYLLKAVNYWEQYSSERQQIIQNFWDVYHVYIHRNPPESLDWDTEYWEWLKQRAEEVEDQAIEVKDEGYSSGNDSKVSV